MNLHELLLSFPNPPLIPCETAVNLLKIESKFVSSHPCLCTSRFRHTLHQLDVEHHQELDRLCNKLPYVLNIEDEGIENAYSDVIPFVFGDIQKLEEKITNEFFTRSGTKPLSKTQPPILHLLNNIVSRLVTEYRAIFAIEVEFSRSFEKSDDEFHPIERKRHEEVDNCPEEIKSMKVACEELSLECTSSSDGSSNQNVNNKSEQTAENVENEQENNHNNNRGPKFCLKSLTSQEMPEKDNSIHRSAAQYNSALEDTRSRHRRSNHHFIHHSTSRSADEKISIALTPVKVVVQEDQDVLEGLDDARGCIIHDNTTDSTPVSSDVEQNPSPRRACLRKRKERRDSIGDGQDTKLCKSSSEVFPYCLDGQNVCSKIQPEIQIRRVQSTIDFVDTSNNNKDENVNKNQKSIESNLENGGSRKCIFYVSEDEEILDGLVKQDDTKTQRAIVKPRRSRKPKLEICQREDQLGDFDPEPNSPILPWKKSCNLSPVNMCAPLSLSISSVPNLVTSLKSSVANNETSDLSDSSSTSSSDPPEPEVEPEDEIKPTNFYVKTLHIQHSPPIQDIQNHVQPISWEPHGAIASDLLDSEAKHFGLLHSRQHLEDRWNTCDSEYMVQQSKIKKLSKQLEKNREKIENLECRFEDEFGDRPSDVDKQNSKTFRKLLLQQSRLKRQIRHCRESGDSGIWEDYSPPVTSPNRPESPSCSDFSALLNVYSDSSNDSLQHVVHDLEETLEKDRESDGRPLDLNSMTPEQVIQEKQSIQRVLNKFQNVLKSTSATDKERLALSDLLQRYSSVKRLMRRSSNVLIKEPSELQTIPEGSEIQLTLASPQHRINIEMNGTKIKDELLEDIPVKNQCTLVEPNDFKEEQNLHALSRIQLINVHRTSKEEKKQLKRKIKEKEIKFLEDNGKPMPKEDIKEQEFYSRYKMVKAKLKLVDALLSKKM